MLALCALICFMFQLKMWEFQVPFPSRDDLRKRRGMKWSWWSTSSIVSCIAIFLLLVQCILYWEMKALKPKSWSFHKDTRAVITFYHRIWHMYCVTSHQKTDSVYCTCIFFLLLALRANFILKYFPLFKYSNSFL